MTRGVRSIVIAIADDSVDITHPYFQGRRQNRLTHRFKRRRHFPDASSRLRQPPHNLCRRRLPEAECPHQQSSNPSARRQRLAKSTKAATPATTEVALEVPPKVSV